MSDWRRKAQRKADQRGAVWQREQEKECQRKELTVRLERACKVAELGRKFRCHVCGVSAKTPHHVEYGDDYTEGGWGAGRSCDLWDRPGDLNQCGECGRYVCNGCSEAGVCRKCAEGGILWRWFRVG